MKISFEGIGEKAVTFIGDGVKEGDLVRVTGPGTVSTCGAGDGFDGFVAGLRGEYAAVVISGAVTAPFSGTAPGFGRVELFADGEGGVCVSGGVKAASEGDGAASSGPAASGGLRCLVVDVDEIGETVTFIMP